MQSNCDQKDRGNCLLDTWPSVLHELACWFQSYNTKLRDSDKNPSLSLVPSMKNCLGCLRIKSLGQRDTMRFLLHNMLHVVNEKITRYTGISSLSSSIVSLIGD